MTHRRETLNVKREMSHGKAIVRETSFTKRISFLTIDVSRFTFHETRTQSQAGR
jgi:hypothetical protein